VRVATERHAEVAERVFTELPHLACDTGFHRFPFLEPIDPLA
jgi:hypothetical protein